MQHLRDVMRGGQLLLTLGLLSGSLGAQFGDPGYKPPPWDVGVWVGPFHLESADFSPATQ